MITTQVIEEYVKSQPLVTRQLFSAILASKNPATKYFLVRYMAAVKEKLQEAKAHVRTNIVDFGERHWFSLVTEKISLDQLITVFQADSNSKKQSLKFQLFNQHGLALLPIINSATALNALKDSSEEQKQIMNAICLATMYNGLLPIQANTFNQEESEIEEISIFVGEKVASTAIGTIFRSLVDEEVDIINDIFQLLARRVESFRLSTKCSSFEAALLTTLQICVNKATIFGLQFSTRQISSLHPYARMPDTIEIRREFYLRRGEETIKLINEQLTVKQFVKEYSALPRRHKDCFAALLGRSKSYPSALEVWYEISRICIECLTVVSVEKGWEVTKNIKEWFKKRYSQEQIVTKLDLSNTEQKLSIIWRSIMHLSENEWMNLNRQSNFFALLNNFCEKIRSQALFDRQTLEAQNISVEDITCSFLISQVDSKFDICSKAIASYHTLEQQAAFIDSALATKF